MLKRKPKEKLCNTAANVFTRDEDLDLLRGFAMLWVIFIHVLYWIYTGGGINLLLLSLLHCLKCHYSSLFLGLETQ